MIVAFTGHRPQKLGGYNIPNPIYDFVKKQINQVLTELSPKTVISGMALGVDQWAAEICIDLQIPFIAAIPFIGQENYWPEESRKRYSDLLAHAESIECINNGGFASWKMQTRNVWMVDNSDVLVAVFDGTPGGTKNCFDYAEGKGKKIIRINPLDAK